MISTASHDSPLGPLLLVADESAVRELRFPGDPRPVPETASRSRLLTSLRRELDRYFAGRLARFETRCGASHGTELQRAVWRAVARVRAGRTITYAELAVRVGRPTAIRAVATANARNPLPIVVPCHRVVGARGRLVGYTAGVDAKRFLLELEGALPATC
ncbi:MAG: methylated-DNA--[protein]-cysteine S-methyltransferase [Planctomycetes bacterium]|nr:methylated-DNA--[protein]-cysteine S-methyltransferase [Planctomycetota bacterium]